MVQITLAKNKNASECKWQRRFFRNSSASGVFTQSRAAANPAWRRGLQFTRPVRRVAELGSLGVYAMSSFTPMFACRGLDITPGDLALFLLLAVGWLAAVVFCFANFVLIFRVPHIGGLFRLIHGAIWISYIGLGVVLFNFARIIEDTGWAGLVGQVLTIVIPLIVIGHFIYLLIYRRRFNHAIKQDT